MIHFVHQWVVDSVWWVVKIPGLLLSTPYSLPPKLTGGER